MQRTDREEFSAKRTPTCGVAVKFGTRGLDVGGELASILLRRANNLALLTRHGTYALAALTALVDPTSRAGPAGKWLMTGLVAWALYRLATRSRRGVLIAIDCLFMLAMCATTPLLNASVESLDSSAQLAIVGTAIIGFTVALPAHVSLAITALVLTTYAWGVASVVGWENVAAMVSLRYLPIAAVMGVLLRITLLRVAAATRRAHENYLRAGEMRKRVAAAARDYEREQFALLHDTVAFTLLLVGNGTAIPRDRLAAQARSALDVIDGQRSAHTPRRIELVAALRELAGGTCTPVRFSGSSRLWLDGKLDHDARGGHQGDAEQRRPARARHTSLSRRFGLSDRRQRRRPRLHADSFRRMVAASRNRSPAG